MEEEGGIYRKMGLVFGNIDMGLVELGMGLGHGFWFWVGFSQLKCATCPHYDKNKHINIFHPTSNSI